MPLYVWPAGGHAGPSPAVIALGHAGGHLPSTDTWPSTTESITHLIISLNSHSCTTREDNGANAPEVNPLH